jgi:hypothetical protein
VNWFLSQMTCDQRQTLQRNRVQSHDTADRFCREHGELRDLLCSRHHHNQTISASSRRSRFSKCAWTALNIMRTHERLAVIAILDEVGPSADRSPIGRIAPHASQHATTCQHLPTSKSGCFEGGIAKQCAHGRTRAPIHRLPASETKP